jgi:inorganic pyrophosphatase
MVESPRGATVKFKYDAANKVMTISRPLPEGLAYPYDWGFIPSTRAQDGDPLDAVIVWDGTSYPGVVIPCRVIGALCASQINLKTRRRVRNDRIVALPIEAPRQAHITSVFDLPQRERDEMEQFFLHTVIFQGKELRMLGWVGPDRANKLIRQLKGADHKRRSRQKRQRS